MFYLRAQTTAREDEPPDDWSLGAPSLVDAYLDARPNERVRGLVVGRLLLRPDPAGPGRHAQRHADRAGRVGRHHGDQRAVEPVRGPHPRSHGVALDQMWLRFDLKHRVFVTAGKQHVRWGTARFWTPTDFLHIRRRNPLDVFDARTGTTMLKLHVPWEALGWNFYAYGLLEDSDATPQLGNVAGAARAEIVLGTTELGLGALVQRGRKPQARLRRLDRDLGLRSLRRAGPPLRQRDRPGHRGHRPDAARPSPRACPALVEALYPLERRSGIKPQVVGGASYSRKYNDNDVFHVGRRVLLQPARLRRPGRLPRPGAAADGAAAASRPPSFTWAGTTARSSSACRPPTPGTRPPSPCRRWATSRTGSFITRLDYALTLLTHLRFEAFAAVHYGDAEGEFRFGIRNLQIAGMTFSSPPAVLDLGLGLRVSL